MLVSLVSLSTGAPVFVEALQVSALEPIPASLSAAAATRISVARGASSLTAGPFVEVVGAPAAVAVLLAVGGAALAPFPLLSDPASLVYLAGGLALVLDPVPMSLGGPSGTRVSVLRGASSLTAGPFVEVVGTPAAVAAALPPGGGGGGLVNVPNRRDHSVNGASVDLFDTTQAILRTKTDQHPAGAYTGGGIGNKSILGHFLPAPMPLAALVSVDFTIERLTPEQTTLAPNTIPYGNLVVELVPGSGTYSILVFGDVLNPLLLGAYSTPGPNLNRCLWTAASPGSGVLVVLGKGMFISPSPPGALFVPASQSAPAIYVAAAWQSFAFSIAGILAFYPLAQIVNAYSADAGLPKAPNITSGLMLIAGSSGNSLQNAVRVRDWRLNGAPI